MKQYFWVWQISSILYAISITFTVLLNDGNVHISGHIIREIFQINAILCIYYLCHIIDNIPYGFTGVRYSIIFVLFLIVYSITTPVDQVFFVSMLIFKLTAVLMTIFTIVVKWSFSRNIKIIGSLIFGSSGCYLSIYNFLMFENHTFQLSILFIGIGILFLVVQNIFLAVLYKIQTENQEKLKGDYLTVFAENSADIIFFYTFTPYPRFSFISPAASSLLGYSPDEFYRNRKLPIELTIEQDREKMEEIFSDFEGDKIMNTVRVEGKDGYPVTLECYATKINVNGKNIAVEGVLRDITERAEAEKKVIENNRNRQLMLSYISHDLKTPITYVISYAEAIVKGVLKTQGERLKAVEAILFRAKSLNKLVEDISMLSKLETSQFNYSFEKIRCIDLINRIQYQYINHFPGLDGENGFLNRDYRFQIKTQINDEHFVLIDQERFDQVLENLMSNALKVTKDGDKISISCLVDIDKNELHIAVTDEGVGIDREDLPHIFENFYRSPQTKKRMEGSGLGLSLTKQIINGHGGRIEVISEPDKGSKFTVILPLYSES